MFTREYWPYVILMHLWLKFDGMGDDAFELGQHAAAEDLRAKAEEFHKLAIKYRD